MNRICIVDNGSLCINTITARLEESNDMIIAGTVTSAEILLDQFEHILPEIVLIDLNLCDRNGLQAIISIKSGHPEIKFLLLTDNCNDDKLFDAFMAGADGCLDKRDLGENIVVAIRDVIKGGAPIIPEVAKRVINYIRDDTESEKFKQLTSKERIVLHFLAEGLLYKEISDRLDVGIDAVKKHAQNIYGKLRVRTRSEAIATYLGRKGGPFRGFSFPRR